MKRVLFRLWLVLSVCWIGFAYFASSYDNRPEAAEIATKVALIPPLGVFALGTALVWAFGGFDRQ